MKSLLSLDFPDTLPRQSFEEELKLMRSTFIVEDKLRAVDTECWGVSPAV